MKNFLLNKYFGRLPIWVFLIAFSIRIVFLVWGAGYFYEQSIHLNGDSRSYTQSFLNLYYEGHYSHDFSVEDASFGRLPGYPFFWGLHYLLFGWEKVNFAVSFTQVFLDSFSAILVFLLAYQLTQRPKPSLIAGLVYAVYPFSLVWTTIVGTEILATFLTLLIAYILFQNANRIPHLVLIGFLLSFAFYTREYLGILVLFAGIYLFFRNPFSLAIRKLSVILVVFTLLYLPWPIRNYLNHGRIVFLKPTTAGYAAYAEDVNSFRKWLFSWHPSDWQPYFDEIVFSDNDVNFPEWVFANNEERQKINHLIRLSRECGSGFSVWNPQRIIEKKPCTEEISSGFMDLRNSFIRNNPRVFFLDVPAKNVFKSFFNLRVDSQKNKSGVQYFVFQLLFFGRGVALIFALVAGLCCTVKVERYFLLGFFAFMLLFISFYIRQVEMRYLLQAETLILPFLAIFFHKASEFFASKSIFKIAK